MFIINVFEASVSLVTNSGKVLRDSSGRTMQVEGYNLAWTELKMLVTTQKSFESALENLCNTGKRRVQRQ